MSTRELALGIVIAGLALGVTGSYYRAAACGTDKACDEYWNAAGLATSGAVGMGWAWLTKAPGDDTPSEPAPRRTTRPKNPD